jgi:transaldolase
VSGVLQPDGGDAEKVLAEFRRAGVDDATLAEQLQREGTAAFDKSWKALMDCIESKRDALAKAARTEATHP